MSRSVARVVTALLLLSAGPAAAETLYNQDGVLMSATAVAIHRGAATCRIRQERHTAEQYEKLKPNEGQPLNVWRVELVVANYSGRALDYLNAHLNVESDWPPCDHWDGPEAHYGAAVVWTGPLMSIQDVGIVEPGEEVRETAFVLAWHEEEPALGRWDINYDFAAAPAAGGTAAETRPESTGTGRAAATEREVTGAAEAPPAGMRQQDNCTGREFGPCWMEIETHPGCHVWFPGRARRGTVTWTGDCPNGLASGVGALEWNLGTIADRVTSYTSTGELQNGKMHGHWTLRWTDGGFWDVWQGPYKHGKMHGRWVHRFADGGVLEGLYVDGKEDGLWTTRFADGEVQHRCYSNGDEVDCP